MTDIAWTASSRVRAWRGGSISTIYYTLLCCVTVFGAIAVRYGTAIELFTFLGVMANIVLALGAVQILFVNRKLLSRELRPPLWREGALILCAVFYAFVTACVVYQQACEIGSQAALQATTREAV